MASVDEKKLFEQIMRDLMNPFVDEEKLGNIYKLFLSESFSTIFDENMRASIRYYFEMFLNILKVKTEDDLKQLLLRFFCQKNPHVKNSNEMIIMLTTANMHKLSYKSHVLEFKKRPYTFDDLKRTTLYRNMLIDIAKENGYEKVEDYIKFLESDS